jgi:hypothetical protein
MDWIDLAQGRDQWRALVKTDMSLRIPWKFGKFFSSCRTCRFSRRAQLHRVSLVRVLHDENGESVTCSPLLKTFGFCEQIIRIILQAKPKYFLFYTCIFANRNIKKSIL